ncbi:MAG: pyruvate ferredoxin oxidoreductase [bacterium]|nr:pyruvate ferredoxin oxidoreductase [bacterium]
MRKVIAATGNQAIAIALRQIEPDVMCAYPITPSTQIMETYAQYIADGIVKTELRLVESEHSAMSACIGASAAGARVVTASSSQGIALMHEILYIASGLRLPIVMAVANRALSAPINIHGDHSDTMGSRDAGWIQLYAKNAQEAYDTIIQAIRIAEGARLPVMVCFDGFTISHSVQRIEILEDAEVKDFIGVYKPEHSLLDIKRSKTFGTFALPNFYAEIKYQQRDAMRKALYIIKDIDTEFLNRFGTSYGLFETYMLEDAEIATVVIGSTAGTLKYATDEMRKEGIRAGMLRIRAFRPFPAKDITDTLKHLKAIMVLDRTDSPGTDGPLYQDICSALIDMPIHPSISNFMYGLGGRELALEKAKRIYRDLADATRKGIKVEHGYDVRTEGVGR